jgi:hypothetical protein
MKICTGAITRLRYTSLMQFVIIVLLCCLFACKGNDTKEDENENPPVLDSAQTARSIAADDSTILFDNNARIASTVKRTNVNWQQFHLDEFWFEDSLKKSELKRDDAFYKRFAAVLRWSPDSSCVLDMGSMNKTILRDSSGKSRVTDGDIDTQIALLYPKEKQKSDLLFFGSASSLIDARWVDSSQLAIFGVNYKAAGQRPDTLLWLINPKEKYFRKYKWE